MKSEQFPVFLTSPQNAPKVINTQQFISHLSQLHEPRLLQQHLKKIQENIYILTKQPQNEEHIQQLVSLLCKMLKQVPMAEIVTLIRSAICPDLKYQARQKQNDDVLNNENIRNAFSSQPIALPYEPAGAPVYGPIALPAIAIHNQANTDTIEQERQSDNKSYYEADDLLVQSYLQKQFKTVKREGISDFFTKIAELISTQLLQDYLQKNFLNLHTPVIVELIKLLDYISPPIYTCHLQAIGKAITNKLFQFLSLSEKEKVLTKDDYQAISCTFNNIAQRLINDPAFNLEIWNWETDTRMIILFMKSSVSQKKLFAIKVLGQICRKSTYYNYSISTEEIKQFIINNSIMEQIYDDRNHPEVIAKGEEVYLYMSKNETFTTKELNIIFNILEKCNENLSRLLFNTLQKIQQKNIENNRHYILRKIAQLPRSNCFNDETFVLIQKIGLLTPPEDLTTILENIFAIISKHYTGFRSSIRDQSVKLYLEVYVMSIQLTVIDESNALAPLHQLLTQPQSPLYLHMIECLISTLKDKTYHKSIGTICRKVLKSVIKTLMKHQKFHRLKTSSKDTQIKILMMMLESYEESQNDIVSHEELWLLIKENNKFSKFIKNYPEEIQIKMISSLIQSQDKTSRDLQCVIDLYQLLNPTVRKNIDPLIVSEYHKTKNIQCKCVLAPEILKIEPLTFQKAIENIQKQSQDHLAVINWLIIIRQIVLKEDEKGYGEHPPFLFFNNSYDVFIKVFCHKNIGTSQFELTVKSYSTLLQIATKILALCEQDFEKSKIKVNDTYLELPDLKKRISEFTGYRKISIEIYQTEQCQWVDKAQLFDKDNSFKSQVADALKEVFYKFNDQKGKLFPANIADIFKIATSQQYISAYDSRVTGIINIYSNTGTYLTLEEWLNFYFQSALKHSTVVVSNLINLGYRELFNQKQTFKDMFTSDHELRRNIANDSRIYSILFGIFQEVVKNSSQNQLREEMTEQLINTLNLLPTHENLLKQVQEHKPSIFSHQNFNHLYNWYTSKLLKCLYFNQESTKWKEQFQQSGNLSQLKQVYIHYIQLIFSQSQQQMQKDHIVITNLQNLGRIVRQNLSNIPLLNNFNLTENVPLTSNNAEDKNIQSVKIKDFSLVMNQLNNLCMSVYKTQKNICIVENAMAVVIHLILRKCLHEAIRQLPIIQTLIFNEVEAIRKLFNSFYFLLSNIVPSIKQAFYSIRIKRETHSKTCKEYFSVLSKILSFEDDQKYYNYLSDIYQQDISNYPVHCSSFQNSADEVLLGELKVLNQIILYNPKLSVEHSTKKAIEYLLQSNSAEDIRIVLYRMSNSLCDFQTNIIIINSIMDGLKLSRNSSKRSMNKMGMVNLGCTCYINSVVQQLQYILPFRQGIISAEIPENNLDFFREFQFMVYHLTFGQRSYFTTQNFCLNFLDYSGQPVNVRMQHDADEFLNTLFDKLETSLKGTNEESLISQNFRGEVINTIHCDSCFNIKEKIENVYIVSLQIKNFKSLEECLNKYVEHQIITDYSCEYCDRKVESIQKYNLFKNLPTFLFIHLQRLVFDLEEFRKIKLDHIINFPQQMDFSRYFKGGALNAQYKLKGFVVHIGSSEGGHYYSIIKCDDQWLKFDDTRVDVWNWRDGSFDWNNAYMLIYERQQIGQQKMKKEMNIGNKKIMEEIKQDNYHLQKQNIFLQPSFMRFLLDNFLRINIPSQFQIEPHTLLNPYHDKLLELDVKIQEQLQLGFQTIFNFFKLEIEKRQLNINGNITDMYSNNNQKPQSESQFQKLGLYLLYCLHFRPNLTGKLAEEYLSQEKGNLFDVIFMHRDLETRQITKVILCKVFSILKTQIYTNFMVPVPQTKTLQRLLEKILASLTQVGKNTQKMDLFFQLIIWLIKADDRFCQWFQCHKFGPRLIHFLLQNDSPLQSVFPSYPFYLNSTGKNHNIEMIIEILINIVKHEKDLSKISQETQVERKAYLNFELYRRMFKDRYDNNGIPTLIAFCAKNNPQFNKQAVNFITENLNRTSHTDKFIFTFISTMYHLLIIQDSLQRQRLEKILGVPLLLKKYEKEGQEYMVKTRTDRFCRYQNAAERCGDQIFFSFLELLYINRREQNYFVFLGIIALLQLKSSSKIVSEYLENLPGPCPAYPNYTDWIHEFLYDSQKCKNEIHRDISAEDKQTFLTQIAKLINIYQNTQQESRQKQESRNVQHNANNKPFDIKQTLTATQWVKIPLSFENHIKLQDEIPEDFSLKQSQVIDAQQRILSGPSSDNVDTKLIIQYRITFHCRLKIEFIKGFPYSFYFEKGCFEFALPYFQNQSENMRCWVPEGELKKIMNRRKQQTVKKMDIENEQLPQQRASEEFPTINEVYATPNDINNAVNEAKVQEQIEPGTTFECPFCLYVSTTYSSRCKNCNEQLGQMNWY